MFDLRCIESVENYFLASVGKRLPTWEISNNDDANIFVSKRRKLQPCCDREVDSVSASSATVSPLSVTSNVNLNGSLMQRRKVRFDSSKNIEYLRYYSAEDKREAWLQPNDFVNIKRSLIKDVVHIRRERCLNGIERLSIAERIISPFVESEETNCMRGLEHHFSNETVDEKKRHKIFHTELILHRHRTLHQLLVQTIACQAEPIVYQSMTRNIANEIVMNLLSQFASQLSSIDTQNARRIAEQDVFDATVIHFLNMNNE
jgi:hypothetical protein